ncbi:MAG: hypothetical protein EOM67_01670 [Spirochaetia bacterium]|nr:hypothetical protein [Spirochaetia bacterium]
MNKKILTITILIVSIMIPLSAADLSYSGLSHTSLATRFSEGDIAHYKQSIDLSVDIYKDISHFFIQPYLTLTKDSGVAFDVREAYAEFYFETIDLKIGKQIIASGQADALYLSDIISPRNVKDFILTETNDMRKGVPAIKGSYYVGNYTIEGIWITQAIPTTTFSLDSIWISPPSILPTGATATMSPPAQIEPLLKNSEVFAKLCYFGSSISYEIVGGYTYSDEPHISSLTVNTSSPLSVTLSQEYARYPVLGGSFSTAIGPVVLRGEANVSFNKKFTSISMGPSPTATPEEHHYIQSLIGLDWKLFGFDMSSQYMLSFIEDYHQGLVYQGRYANEFSHLATYRLQKKFFEDRFTFQLFTLIELDPLNALIRPSLTYEIEDAVSLKGEVILFVGDEDGLYGTHKDNSLASVSLYWYF